MKIHAIKILIFALLIAGFYAFGGFERPRLSHEMPPQKPNETIGTSNTALERCG